MEYWIEGKGWEGVPVEALEALDWWPLIGPELKDPTEFIKGDTSDFGSPRPRFYRFDRIFNTSRTV